MSSVLPFHNPVVPSHKRNRSPPLTGSATTSFTGDGTSTRSGGGVGGIDSGIGLGVTTTVSDGAAQRTLFGVTGSSGGAVAEKAKEVKDREEKPKQRPAWRRGSWCGALKSKIPRPKKTKSMAPAAGVGGAPFRSAATESKRLALKNHFVACVGEFVGTVLFIFLALGSSSVANLMATSVTGNAAASGKGAAPNTSSLFYISCGAGLSLMVTTFTFARASGAFPNPAVSLGMALTGALKPVRAGLLICVQFLGGLCGAAIVSALTPGSRTFTTMLAPAMSVTRGLFLEMMLTAVLVLTILFLVAEKHKGSLLAPVGIGLALFAAELYGVYWTGGSLNPARSLGPAMVLHSFPDHLWIYILGPSLGAILAAAFYKILKWLEYETVIPSTPDLPRGVSVPANSAYQPCTSYTAPYQGPVYPDLLTHEAPTLSTVAALRSGATTGMRNAQLQERFDRLEEIIEQLGGRDSFELSRSTTQELGVGASGGGSGDELSRGKWCHPSCSSLKANGLTMSPSDTGVSAVLVAGAPENNNSTLGSEAHLIDSLAPLHKYDGGAPGTVVPNGMEGRKQQ